VVKVDFLADKTFDPFNFFNIAPYQDASPGRLGPPFDRSHDGLQDGI